MWFPIAFYPALAATVIFGVLLGIVFKVGLRKPGNKAAFVLFLSFFIWSFGEMVERMAGPPPMEEALALAGAKLLSVGVFLLLPAGIHFGWDFPYRVAPSKAKLRRYVLYAAYITAVISGAVSAFTPVFISSVSPYSAMGQEIWGIEHTGAYSAYLIADFGAALFLLSALIFKYTSVKIPVVRKQILFVLIGLLISFLLVVVTAFVPMLLDVDSYPLTTFSFTILATMILYTILRYRLFLVTPVSEEVVEEAEALLPGIYEKDREDAYAVAASLARSGHPTIIFTPLGADEVREQYGLKETMIFQLTSEAGKDRLNPAVREHLEMLPFIAMSFAGEAGEDAVLLLDHRGAVLEIAGEEALRWVENELKGVMETYPAVYIVVSSNTTN